MSAVVPFGDPPVPSLSYSTAYPVDGVDPQNCYVPYPWDVRPYTPWPWESGIGLTIGTTVTSNTLVADKPHEAIDKATRQIASAARDLVESADKMGVPIDRDALREAIIKRLDAALSSRP